MPLPVSEVLLVDFRAARFRRTGSTLFVQRPNPQGITETSVRRKRTTGAGATVAAVLATLLAAPSAGTAHAADPERLVIDLAADTGAFHGGAAGSLYGIYGDGAPSRNLIEGMHLRTLSTKAHDGPQHPGADALEVLPPFVDSGGKDVYIYMTDIYRGFSYQWPGDSGPERLADFKEKIKKQVAQVKTMGGYKDHVVYVPFNEPEGNMFGSGTWSYNNVSWLDDPQYFFAAWKEVYHLIKDQDPDARIAGPNTSLLFDQVKGFLQYAEANDVVPDVMTWHELSSPAAVRTSVAKYRQWEQEVGIGPLPINVNDSAVERPVVAVRRLRPDVRPHRTGDRPAPQPAVHPPGRGHARREEEAVPCALRRRPARTGCRPAAGRKGASPAQGRARRA